MKKVQLFMPYKTDGVLAVLQWSADTLDDLHRDLDHALYESAVKDHPFLDDDDDNRLCRLIVDGKAETVWLIGDLFPNATFAKKTCYLPIPLPYVNAWPETWDEETQKQVLDKVAQFYGVRVKKFIKIDYNKDYCENGWVFVVETF